MLETKWDSKKNAQLIKTRGVSFLQIEDAIKNNKIVDVLSNPSPLHKEQAMFVVLIDKYIHVVPFDKKGDKYILRTIYKDRKLNKKYKEERLK